MKRVVFPVSFRFGSWKITFDFSQKFFRLQRVVELKKLTVLGTKFCAV